LFFGFHDSGFFSLAFVFFGFDQRAVFAVAFFPEFVHATTRDFMRDGLGFLLCGRRAAAATASEGQRCE
jgi:hypothetical protein